MLCLYDLAFLTESLCDNVFCFRQESACSSGAVVSKNMGGEGH